jgi:outer membrane protein assembly factor BamB
MGGHIYWSDYSDRGGIERVGLDGTGRQAIVTGLNYPFAIALDVGGGSIYWTELISYRIKRASLDGTGVVQLLGPESGRRPAGLALDLQARRMYWTDQVTCWADTGKISSANLDGTDVRDVLSPGNNPQVIRLDVPNGKMYWTEIGVGSEASAAPDGKIRRARLDGTEIETLVTGVVDPEALALDLQDGRMYWGDFYTGTISRGDLEGGNAQILITGLTGLRAFDLDLADGKIYLSRDATSADSPSRIQRADLDGTNLQDFLITGGRPDWIAFGTDAIPEPCALIVWSLLGASGVTLGWWRRRKRAA